MPFGHRWGLGHTEVDRCPERVHNTWKSSRLWAQKCCICLNNSFTRNNKFTQRLEILIRKKCIFRPQGGFGSLQFYHQSILRKKSVRYGPSGSLKYRFLKTINNWKKLFWPYERNSKFQLEIAVAVKPKVAQLSSVWTTPTILGVRNPILVMKIP